MTRCFAFVLSLLFSAELAAQCRGYEAQIEELEAVLSKAQQDTHEAYYPEIDQICIGSKNRVHYSIVWPPQRHNALYSRHVRLCRAPVGTTPTEVRCERMLREISRGANRWFIAEPDIGMHQLQEILAQIDPASRYGEEIQHIGFAPSEAGHWSLDVDGYLVTLGRSGLAKTRILRLRYDCSEVDRCRWHLAKTG